MEFVTLSLQGKIFNRKKEVTTAFAIATRYDPHPISITQNTLNPDYG